MNIEHGYLPDADTALRTTLRILATSDIHMHLRGYDYLSCTQTRKGGLSRLAGVIAQARAEQAGAPTVLLDNGDALQGSALADAAAQAPVTQDHPLVRAFEALNYDAIGLGNHDFDFGLPYLAQVTAHYTAPAICSNLECTALPMVQPWTIVQRNVEGQADAVPLKIGVVSVLPQQTMIWNSAMLAGQARIAAMDAALRVVVPEVRAAGADIVVLLAHSGLGVDGENAATALAAHPMLDAVIAGHTHATFPLNAQGSAQEDPIHGTLNGTPAAMPGFGASHLAQVDLELVHDGERWQVTGHHSTLRPALGGMVESPAIMAATDDAHTATRAHLSQPVGQVTRAVHSYFNLVQGSPEATLAAAAKCAVIAEAAHGTELAHLPMLGAAAAYASGGHRGPANYVDIPAGTVMRRQVTQMLPFENEVWASVLTGAQVRGWLDRSASAFATLVPGAPAQPLLLPGAAGFNFDMLSALSFEIDLTVPPLFDVQGRVLEGGQSRVRNLQHDGRPVRDTDRFLIASTNYRLAGAGNYPGCTQETVALRSGVAARAALERFIARDLATTFVPAHHWRLTGGGACVATFATGAGALAHLDDLAGYDPQVCREDEEGYVHLRLSL